MPISKPNIDRSDIIGTFHRGKEFASTYYQIKELQSQGLSVKEIMGQCGNLGDANAIRRRVKAVAVNGRRPRSVKAVEYLEDLDLLPMNPENPKFELFNIIASIVFAHGSRTAGGGTENNTVTCTRVMIDRPEQYHVIAEVLTALGMDDFNGGIEKGYVDTNTRLGRLIQAAGYPAGAKRKTELTLPHYIDQALSDYLDERIPFEERVKLLPMLRDFMHTILFYRGLFSKRQYFIHLNTFETPEKSGEQAAKMKQIARASFPSLSPSFGNVRRHSNNGTYYHRLTMRRGQGGIHPEVIDASYRERITKLVGELQS